MRQNFYVYLLLDPTTSQPFYVGKGTGRRMYEHYRIRSRLTNPLLKNKLIKLADDGLKPIYERVLINAAEDQCFSLERELIAKYGKKVDGSGILCNLTDGGEGNTASHTTEQRQKRSERMKGHRGTLPILDRPVSQYTTDGTLISTYPSAKVASETVSGANRSYITQCCKKKRVSAGGFLWSYEGDPPKPYIKQSQRGVHQLSTDGTLIQIFASLTAAECTTGVTKHNISQCCRGKSKTAGGYIWKYVLPV